MAKGRFAFFEKLTPREQKLATALGVVAAVMLLFGLPAALEAAIASKRSDNEEMREAIAKIQDARSQVRDRQARKDAIALRYANKAPPLAGFIEQSARSQKLEVSDSVDRPELPGKQYTERTTVVHLKKAGMLPIARLLESIERSGHPVVISRLNIRKRTAEQDSWDVELGVSAYDRSEQPKKEALKEMK
jgi:general secretion pathway protein M